MLGVLHPGQMGAAVAAALRQTGHEVGCALDDRSPATRARARTLDLTDVGTVPALVQRSEIIISVCPPQAALAVAHDVAGYAGVFVDANAISPRTAGQVAAIVQGAGATYVDAAIIGAPPLERNETRLYVSGPGADAVASAFRDSLFDARVLSSGPYAASALKMMYAAWTKGTAGLLLAIDAGARRLGVDEALMAEWDASQPQLAQRLASSRRSAAGKAWRWSPEMEEVATTFADVNLPAAFHRGAAEIFARLPSDLAADDPRLAERIGDALAIEAQTEPKRPTTDVAPRSPSQLGGLLSRVRRPADTMSFDELLASWAIELGATENVTWFSPGATGTSQGFVLVTDRRLWFIDLDGNQVRHERALETIVATEERGGRRRRLRVRGDDWEIEFRALGGGRSLSDLRIALSR